MPAAPFAPSWLAADPPAVALLPRGYAHPAARRAAVAAVTARTTHPDVLATLSARTPAQQAHLDALRRPGTACVVTGQQVGLFGGPLYTIYKAAAAIVNARALEAETGTRCVPVFWLQNEDHDYDEIASCRVLAPDGTLTTVALPPQPEAAGISLWARRLASTAEALATVGTCVAGLTAAPAMLRLLHDSYPPGCAPDAAFRHWLEALFARHGLLVLDPSLPALVEAARPVHLRAVREAGAIATALTARSRALEAAGFTVQVHIREDSPLSFLHPDGREGPRHRVDGLRLAGTDRTVTPAALEAGPHSTSALLRPLLQDSWLPTAAYVAGPGEIAYFAQLPPLYGHFGLPMPLVMPRARFRVVDDTAVRLLDQLGLEAADLGAPLHALLEQVGPGSSDHPDPDALEAALLDPVRATLADFLPHAAALDRGLARATEKSERTLVEVATRLVGRYRRTLARNDEVTVGRLDRLRERLQPGGAPQERVHGWPWFGARYGVQGFVDTVLEAVEPFDGDLKELRP